MRKLVPILAVTGLALVIAPACLYLMTDIDKLTMKNLMLLGSVVWFALAPLWMDREAAPADGSRPNDHI